MYAAAKKYKIARIVFDEIVKHDSSLGGNI